MITHAQIKTFFGLCLLLLAAACASLQSDIENGLYANPDQTGIRWGFVVADMAGTELLAHRPDDRFTPASNTKIVTTMAAYHWLDELEAPELNPGTAIYVTPAPTQGVPPNLSLVGGGDAMLGDGPTCETHCLSELADQVAALGITEFNHFDTDSTRFPLEPYGPGWSQEDLKFYYGAPASALTVNDNVVHFRVAPASQVGYYADFEWLPGDDIVQLLNELETVEAGQPRSLRIDRLPGISAVRIYGTIPIDSEPIDVQAAVANPAKAAMERFRRLLEARGISIEMAYASSKPISLVDEHQETDADAPAPAAALMPSAPDDEPAPVIVFPSAPLTQSLRRISKDSQNLHAELALRRLGLIAGTGSRSHGVARLEQLLEEAGIPKTGYAFHDGSGMSIYNRISPRAMVRLLAFATHQSWFEAWKADQPIAGIDGSLENRFNGTALEGKLFAKTGTLNGANALSGFMQAASGKMLIFSMIANDRPAATSSAIAEMDAALLAIAAAY